MRRAALVAALALALAACGRGASDGGNAATAAMNEEELSQLQHRAPNPELVMQQRWASMFANPAAAVSAANDLGYKVTLPSGSAPYRAASPTQMLPAQKAPITVETGFVASGSKPGRLSAIQFSFETRVNSKARTKRERDAIKIPPRIIIGFLGRFGVSLSNDLLGAVGAYRSADGVMHGVPVKIDAHPIAGVPADKGSQMTITLTAPADAAARKS